uniref:Reverse transcriptase domain-containing protein n=1 Tax=Tanacetum cinerariifolium TaxID=118510 RepID=A0A6L2MH57_TANCI|nr:hypothetical protein [Tanacetum cinerariifolium]
MLEDQSMTKEKLRKERSKSRRKRSRHQEESSNSEYEEGSEDAYEDLNLPYKRPKPAPFTQRITCFKYHRRAKLPRNTRVYEGNKDLEDHLGIFSVVAKQKEWLMPIWCKMFRQTLGGATQNWFDDLDPKSVDSFEELSHKFLEEFYNKKDMLTTRLKFMEYNQIRMAKDDEEKTGFHTEEGVYYFIHMQKELKNFAATLQRMMEKVLADQRGRNMEIHLEDIEIKRKSKKNLIRDVKETPRKLRRVNIKIDPTMSLFGVKEVKFLRHMVTVEGLRADPERIQAIILSPTPKKQVANISHSQRRRDSDVMSTTKDGDNKFYTTDRKEGIQIHVSYVSRPLQGMEICYTTTEKRVQALIHTTRYLRTIFRKHKVKVIPRKEAEGLVMKKFFGQGEQVEGTPDTKEEGTFTLNKKLQAKSTPTPRAWRLYVGKETIEEGSGLEIILVSLEEKMHSYAIRVKFHASNHVMDYEALLAGLAAYTNQGIKTRPSVEDTSSSKKGKAAGTAPRAEPNYNREASGSN